MCQKDLKRLEYEAAFADGVDTGIEIANSSFTALLKKERAKGRAEGRQDRAMKTEVKKTLTEIACEELTEHKMSTDFSYRYAFNLGYTRGASDKEKTIWPGLIAR